MIRLDQLGQGKDSSSDKSSVYTGKQTDHPSRRTTCVVRPFRRTCLCSSSGRMIRLCLNAAQEELHIVYTCSQQSFQNNLKECNNAETISTSFYGSFT